MNKAVVVGCVILAGALVVGCGGVDEDAVAKEKIGLINEIAAAYEKVTDRSSLQAAALATTKQNARLEELRKTMPTWPKGKNYDAEGKAAESRMLKALQGAATKH